MTWEEAEAEFRGKVQSELDRQAALMVKLGPDPDPEVHLINEGIVSAYKSSIAILDDLRRFHDPGYALPHLVGRLVSAEGGCYSHADRCRDRGDMDELSISEYAGSGYGTLKTYLNALVKSVQT